MDHPKDIIWEQVEIARRILRELDQDRRPSGADAERLAELVLALDDLAQARRFRPVHTAR